jgi:hypothetical protein
VQPRGNLTAESAESAEKKKERKRKKISANSVFFTVLRGEKDLRLIREIIRRQPNV